MTLGWRKEAFLLLGLLVGSPCLAGEFRLGRPTLAAPESTLDRHSIEPHFCLASTPSALQSGDSELEPIWIADSSGRRVERQARGRFAIATPGILEELPGPFRRRIASDLVDIALLPTEMTRRDWVRLSAAVATIGAVSLLDDEIRSLLRLNTDESQRFARTIRPLGQEASIALLGTSWLIGKQWDKPRFSGIAVDGFEASVVASGFISPILKGTLGRSRPYLGQGSTSFGGSESFPSGETTQAFAVASVVAAHSDSKWVDALAYGLAGLTAWQRIELDAHWASDVVAGAVIGTAVGRWVVRRNGRVAAPPRWSLSPLVSPEGAGVAVRISLGHNDASGRRSWE